MGEMSQRWKTSPMCIALFIRIATCLLFSNGFSQSKCRGKQRGRDACLPSPFAHPEQNGRLHIPTSLFSSTLRLTVNNILSYFASIVEVTHQYLDPESVVQEFQRRVNVSVSRRQMLEVHEKDQCTTGNPIDDCWRCDPNWQTNRQSLADCGIGFGRDAMGGKGGQMYVVTDPADNLDNPAPGTLRFATIQTEPVWITFTGNMAIKLNQELIINSFKTIDGRGADIHITGSGCLSIESVTNIIVHNVHIHNCVPSKGSKQSDGDGITIRHSSKIWVDHCSLAECTDGLIDVTEGSTLVTISNNYFTHHDKVMLLGHSDDYDEDKGMQVTVAFNHFGQGLTQRMPRCRLGYFHVVNNDYTQWGEYAVGGSAHPTINSQGNRYLAPSNPDAKEVTARMDTDKSEWSKWNWRTDGDILLNDAFFVASGDGAGDKYALASSMDPRPAALIDQLTMNAGVFGDQRVQTPNIPSPIQTPTVPSPVQTPNIPSPIQTPTIPSPIQTPNIPSPIQTPTIPSPIQTPNIPSPVQTPNKPSPDGGGIGWVFGPGQGAQGGAGGYPGDYGMIYGKASSPSSIPLFLLIMTSIFRLVTLLPREITTFLL